MSKSIEVIELSNGPTSKFCDDVLEFCSKYYDYNHIPGEILAFPNLKDTQGLRFIEGKVLPIADYKDRDKELQYFDIKVLLTVHANATTYKINEAHGSDELYKNLDNWITKGSKYMKITNHEIQSSTDSTHVVLVTLLAEINDCEGEIVKSPFFDEVWSKYMDSLIKEGVCYAHGKVPVSLRDSLRNFITDLAKNIPVDYHPNSKDIVRDLVHPALYPYIKNVSKTKELPKSDLESGNVDFWGRPYEDSKFQWLPTPFNVSENGKCSILEYINNLDRNMFPQLYQDLESLFEVFLPYFEEVWSYSKTMSFFVSESDESMNENIDWSFKKEAVSFKGKELQVITKIVEYTLHPGQTYEGVWHAEGMSHENIVMTGIYFLDRDTDLEGGELRFKRAFSNAERNALLFNIPQDRPFVINNFSDEGFVPLGNFPTNEGYLLVFPNCHIHKISKLVNTAKNKQSSRRIVVFFIINPDKKIVSTREVPPQQEVISLREAKAYRLELMSERKYDKEKLNVRDIELCEH